MKTHDTCSVYITPTEPNGLQSRYCTAPATEIYNGRPYCAQHFNTCKRAFLQHHKKTVSAQTRSISGRKYKTNRKEEDI